MSNRIVFIHGMFLNPKSWEHWIHFFEKRDFSCRAPPWPLHDGEPRVLRTRVPENLGSLRLQDIVDKFASEIRAYDEKPILIGHSMGGLVAQILVAQGLALMAVCIASVAPNDLIAADWGLLKNVMAITNPLAGHSPYEMSAESFYDAFCNTMTHAQAVEAFDEFAVHDSRQVMRDSLRKIGHIDLGQPHVPMLFVAAEKDRIIPPALVKKNAEHYSDRSSITDYAVFGGRSHYLCGQPGWGEVAGHIHSWILEQSDVETARRLDWLSIEGPASQGPSSHAIIRHFKIGEPGAGRGDSEG